MKSNYQSLFDYFRNEHNLTLTESEMSDVITEVRKFENDGWISVEDATLEHLKRYHIFSEGSVISDMTYIEDLQCFVDDYKDIALASVTHIMPYIIPSPPKSK